MRKIVILLSMAFLLSSCEMIQNGFDKIFKTKETSQEQTKVDKSIYANQVKNGEIKYRYSNGNIKSIVNYKDNKKVGVSQTFYKSGEKQYDIPYQNGKKHGKVIWYYKSGKVYRETEYKNGMKDGYQRKYWESGKLKSEMQFKSNMMAVGLKEVSNTDVVKKVPEITTERINHVKQNGEYILKFRLSNKRRNVKFYIGNLVEGKYFPADAHGFLELQCKNGVGEYKITVNKGTQIVKDLNVVAIESTAYQNTRVLQTKVSISLRNPS